MKVLQINSVCGIGSTGRIATDIHKILKANGHQSYIAYGRYEARDCDSVIKIGNKLDNYIHVAKTRLFDKHGFGSYRSTKELISKIESLNPDVIHLHNIHGYYLNIELLFRYLKKANKPVFWTLHDCWPFTGHCSHFDYIKCDKWKTQCFKCPQIQSYPSSILIDNSKKNYNSKKNIFTGIKKMSIITPSKWMAELVKQSFLGEYPIEVINNGIDLSVFKPTESRFREIHNLRDKFIILGVAGVWEKRKGYDYFIKLSKQLKQDEVIVMVGLPEKQINNLPSNIIGISKTNNTRELAEIYSSADVFLNPTLEDNFPTTNIEALACGTPVITFNTGGSPEIINIHTGFVVTKDNLEEMKLRIEEIKYKSKKFYTNNCVVRAEEKYNKSSKYTDYLNLYIKQES